MARTNENTDVANMVEVLEVTGTLTGHSFCITGHLSKPRPFIQKLITQAGGRCDSNLTQNTDFLITNEDWSAGSVSGKSSKFQKAKNYGTRIITEEKFFHFLTTGKL